MPEGIIHVGFQKCASTFLQKHVFPAIDNYHFINWDNDTEYVKLGLYFLDDINSDSPIFDLSESNILLSREGFMSANLPVAYNKYGKSRSKDIFIANISKLFQNKGKLIFVIRRQDQLVESWLNYKTTYISSDKFFLDYPINEMVRSNIVLSNNIGTRFTEYLDYYSIIKRITTVIGKHKVFVLVFEDLTNNREKFFDTLSQAVGQDLSKFSMRNLPKENASSQHSSLSPSLLMKYHRYENVINHIPLPVQKLLKSVFVYQRNKMRDVDRNRILDLYKENNYMLDKEFGLSLDRYSYY